MVLDVAHLVAGVSGGVASTLVLHPLDLVKIRMQVETGRQKVAVFDFMKTVVRNHGLRGLYTGASPNVVASGLAWGSYFFGYNEIKLLMRNEENEMLSPFQHSAAAMIAGGLTQLITNPLWVIKTRMCSSAATVVPYRSILHGLTSIVKTEGFLALYKGLVPGLVGTTHGAVQFVAYEELKYYLNKSKGLHAEAKLDASEYMWISALSKAFAQFATYPYQVVRSRLQVSHGEASIITICKELWRIEGVGGIYKGLTPSLIRVVPASSITFLVYEHVWRFFSSS